MLAALAIVYILDWAESILTTFVLSVLLSYAIYPIFGWLLRARVPRVLAAGAAVCSLISIVGGLGYGLRGEVTALIDRLPEAVDRLSLSAREMRSAGGADPIENVNEAAKKLNEATADQTPEPGVMRVKIVSDMFDVRQYVWWGSLGILATTAQAAFVLLLVFSFLVSAQGHKRRLVASLGTSFARRRQALRVIKAIDLRLRQYLMVMLLSAVFVGGLTWLAFLALGFDQAGFWAFAAGLLCTVSYVGPTIVFVGTAIMAFLQFDSLLMGLTVAMVSLVITSVQGFWLTPWLTSRAGRVNVSSLILGILFFGWLWGPWGVLFSSPIMMIAKSVCDNVEAFQPIGLMLGVSEKRVRASRAKG